MYYRSIGCGPGGGHSQPSAQSTYRESAGIRIPESRFLRNPIRSGEVPPP